ncbi:hypothetical protein M9Y10_008092 [Tritrichomonas musculus]|uniref:Uncharacterized protein n=1 Tax=Tritrichomonas musculus TaxID=1915356 RepID=A0ABR2IXF7_9EUKA
MIHQNSVLKYAVKRLLAAPYNTEKLNIAYLSYGQKDLMRRRLLERVIRDALPEITQPKVAAFWQHIMSFLPKCLALEII